MPPKGASATATTGVFTATQPDSYYKLTSGNFNKEENCDSEEVCYLKYKFEWQSSDLMCKSNFICTKLQGVHL